MIWNTIAHPRMMHNTGGAGNVDDSVVFSAEALESPVKHMNRDLLATFDFIVMKLLTPGSGVLKFVPILGDFETVYRAAKNKTAINAMIFTKFVTTVERDGKSVAVPDDRHPTRISTEISMPDAIEGRIDMESDGRPSGIADFKSDHFVVCNPSTTGTIILSSYGETYESGYWFNTILPKYKVAEGETEEGGNE